LIFKDKFLSLGLQRLFAKVRCKKPRQKKSDHAAAKCAGPQADRKRQTHICQQDSAVELEWVLRGYCKSSPEGVLMVMRHLLTLPNVEFDNRKFARRATDRGWKPPVKVLT
jgi:hypothetical protein